MKRGLQSFLLFVDGQFNVAKYMATRTSLFHFSQKQIKHPKHFIS